MRTYTREQYQRWAKYPEESVEEHRRHDQATTGAPNVVYCRTCEGWYRPVEKSLWKIVK